MSERKRNTQMMERCVKKTQTRRNRKKQGKNTEKYGKIQKHI